MTLRLWLIRHGPTAGKGVTGWTDVDADLSDQARIDALKAQLPEAPVVSSDLKRTIQTADAIQGPRPRLPHEPDLRETNFGAWEGLTYAEIEARDPALARDFWSAPGPHRAPDGESWDDLATRVQGAIKRQIAQTSGDDLIIVAHFGVIIAALQMANGMPATSAISFQIDNLSLTRIDHFRDGGAFRILSVNENR